MSLTKKILTGALVGGGLIAGYSYYLRIKKTKSQLQIVPTAKVHQVNWDGIIIRLDLLLKNPTKGSFSVKFPFVKLTYKESLVGSSQVVNKDIKIPAYGEAKIEKILVHIPALHIFSVSSSILKAIQRNEQLALKTTLITTIDLGWSKIPVEESHELLLKK